MQGGLSNTLDGLRRYFVLQSIPQIVKVRGPNGDLWHENDKSKLSPWNIAKYQSYEIFASSFSFKHCLD